MRIDIRQLFFWPSKPCSRDQIVETNIEDLLQLQNLAREKIIGIISNENCIFVLHPSFVTESLVVFGLEFVCGPDFFVAKVMFNKNRLGSEFNLNPIFWTKIRTIRN